MFRPAGGADPATDPAYRAKLTALAEGVAMAPGVLAVQEIGDVDVLADLAALAGGGWHCETAAPDARHIRVGFMRRHPLTDIEQVTTFATGLRPIQVDDTETANSAMGRAALRVATTASDPSPPAMPSASAPSAAA